MTERKLEVRATLLERRLPRVCDDISPFAIGLAALVEAEVGVPSIA
jgi:hypothetical protein